VKERGRKASGKKEWAAQKSRATLVRGKGGTEAGSLGVPVITRKEKGIREKHYSGVRRPRRSKSKKQRAEYREGKLFLKQGVNEERIRGTAESPSQRRKCSKRACRTTQMMTFST